MNYSSKEMLPAFSKPGAFSLFVIPHSTDLAYVWCQLPDGAAVAGLQVGGSFVSILERKRLLQQGPNLEILLVEAPQLRDGASCEIEWSQKDGRRHTLQVQARLARWDYEETGRVLKLIAKRFRASNGPGLILGRYLDFVSVGQVPCRLIASFPEGCLVELEAGGAVSDIVAYALTPRGLCCPDVTLLIARPETCTLWIAGAAWDEIYFDISGDLVRARVQDSALRVAIDRGPHSVSDRRPLLDALHATIEEPSETLNKWVENLCQAQASAYVDSAVIEVLGAIRLLEGEVAIFLDITAAAYDLQDLQVHLFGISESASITLIACDVNRPGLLGGQQKLIIKVPALNSPATCYRISWSYNEEPFAVWLHETPMGTSIAHAMARDFMPLEAVHPDVLPDVLHPMVVYNCGERAPGLIRRTDVGHRVEEARAEILVFVDEDHEALHRTLVGLALSVRDKPVNIHLCAIDAKAVDEIAVRAERWSTLYALPLRLSGYSSRTSEAQIVRQAVQGPIPQIVCRAGAIPRIPDWWSGVLKRLDNREGGMLLGLCESGIPSLGRLSRGTMPQFVVNAATRQLISSVAFSAAFTEDEAAALPQVFSWEAFSLSQAAQVVAADGFVRLAPELSFVSDRNDTSFADEFQSKLDLCSLQAIARSFPARRQGSRGAQIRTAG